jgi:ketosteroid isomerase-like protein
MAEWQAVIDRVKAVYAEWHNSKGENKDQWLDLISDGIDFRSLANDQAGIPWATNSTGLAQVRAYLDGLTSTFKMEYFRVEQYVCQGDTIVVVGQTAWTNRATGKQAKTPKVDIWRFGTNGKAISFHEYYDTANLLQASTP